MLTEQGTTDFQLLFTKVKAVPGLPSTNNASLLKEIRLLLPVLNVLLIPLINLLCIFELVKDATEGILFPTAGQTVAG